jgi:hypothetical protein
VKRAALVALAVCGACGKKDAAPGAPTASAPVRDAAVAVAAVDAAPAAAPIPTVRFAIANDAGISTYETGAKGLALLHTAKLDGLEYDYDLVWTAPDALYVRNGGDVSRVVDDKLVPVAPPPKKALATKHTKDETRFDPPQQKLIATADSELWLGRCGWGTQGPEEESCDEWAYARLAPAPVITSPTAPESAPDAPHPAIDPPSAVTATIEDEHVIDAGPDDTAHDPEKILRCTYAGKTIEWPAPDDREGGGFAGMSDLVWLSADPPVFTVTRSDFGLADAIPSSQVFEACTPEQFERGIQVVYGPHDVVAIVADGKATVRWHGHAFTPIEANDVVFAPLKP